MLIEAREKKIGQRIGEREREKRVEHKNQSTPRSYHIISQHNYNVC